MTREELKQLIDDPRAMTSDRVENGPTRNAPTTSMTLEWVDIHWE